MGIVQRNSLMIKTVAFSKKYSETLLHMNLFVGILEMNLAVRENSVLLDYQMMGVFTLMMSSGV